MRSMYSGSNERLLSTDIYYLFQHKLLNLLWKNLVYFWFPYKNLAKIMTNNNCHIISIVTYIYNLIELYGIIYYICQKNIHTNIVN